MNNITVVTGNSGVGKSTIKKLFSERFWWSFEIYDFDDVWVPEGADEQRRKQTTQLRFDTMQENELAGKKSVLFWQLIPDEVTTYNRDKVTFVLLDAPRDVLVARLKQRWRQDDLIDTYRLWSEHIKSSVVKQKARKEFSTDKDVSTTVEELANFILQ